MCWATRGRSWGHVMMWARFGSQGSIALNWHSRYSGTLYSGTWLYLVVVPPSNQKVGFKILVNSSPPGQNGRHFTDDIFRCILPNENFCILFWISLKTVPKSPIDNKSALGQIMVWHQTGDKPLAEPMLRQVYWPRPIYAALGGDELTWKFHYKPDTGILHSAEHKISNVCNFSLWQRERTLYQFLIVVCGGLFATFGSRVADIAGAGALGCLTLAFVAALGWRKGFPENAEVSQDFFLFF